MAASNNGGADLESQKPAPVATSPAPVSSNISAVRSPSGSNGHAAAPETQPLLAVGDDGAGARQGAPKPLQRAMAATFRSTVDLAKRLPAGAVLVFEVLSPVFTNGGHCSDVNRTMTAWLLGLCAAACFFLCFTDSFVDAKGTVRYVVATRTGAWVIDGTPPPPAGAAAAYRLKFIDFFHGVLSVMVFSSVAVFDKNVGSCFVPVLSPDAQQVLTAVPLAGGVVGTMLFATFPSTRHGIGLRIPGV